MEQFVVNGQYHHWRLDKFLAVVTGQTRSQMQKAIKSGVVFVNGKIAKAHQSLKINDRVEIKINSAQPDPQQLPDNKPPKQNFWGKLKERIKNFYLVFAPPPVAKPKIIFQTADYLIIDKPAGLLVHAAANSTEATLVDWLIKKYPAIKKIADSEALTRGDFTFRPGIVHRLDKDVSGLMLIAKNQTAFDYFKKLFQTKQIQKEYLALVHDVMPKDSGIIKFEISRKSNGEQMACHPQGSGKGRPASTEYTVEQRRSSQTLVKIHPLTGRTNQIRAHFFALNHPIVGDRLYQSASYKQREIKRILLHATKLTFTDMNGEQQSFSSLPPPEFYAK